MDVIRLSIARWQEKLWTEGILCGSPDVDDLISLEVPTLYTREEAIDKFLDRGANFTEHSMPPVATSDDIATMTYNYTPGVAPGSVVGEEEEATNYIPGMYACMINNEG